MSPCRCRPALIGVAMAGALTACATNPVTGSSEFTLMSEGQEIQLGQQLDGEVRREMRLYDDAEWQRYVEQVGQRLASRSHRPKLPWHFAIVDQTSVNAFALPGGYVYLTRGILPFLDSEAEFAGVLGHEIGHVTARHAARQYTKSTSAGVGLAVLGIFVPGARPYQDVAGTALGVLFLKYGRDDELQADQLGADYAARAGWDPKGIAGMLTTLSRLDEASTSSRGVPGWLSTHPNPGDRVEKVQPAIAQAAAESGTATLLVDHEPYLRRLDGLVFGDRPEEGVTRGSEFLHTGLKFRLRFPEGWDITNTAQQVVARQPGESVYLLLQLVEQPQGSLETIAVGSMQRAGFRLMQGDRTDIQGLPAYVGTYRGRTDDLGDSSARAAHIAYDRNVFMLVGLTTSSQFARVQDDFTQSIRSFRRLSSEEVEQIRPNRIDLYVARPGDTWQSIASRASGGAIRAATLAIMNHYSVNELPRAGERIKVVVGS